jgi:glycosyltransferase involved in cell wall biosynthesis
MNDTFGVSMVICCYNSSLRIGSTLDYLQKISAKEIPWEVILVDNSSDDNTIIVAQNTWNKNPVTRFTVVSENKRGLMNARIKGVQCAAYNIISFIDDDNWVEPDWINKVFSIMQNDSLLAACGGSADGLTQKKLPDWFDEFSHSFAVGKQQPLNGYVNPEKGYLWGAGLNIRKKAWEDLFSSGFKSLLKGRTGKSLSAGEDSELCFAWIILGWKLWYDDSLKLKHFIPESRLSISYLEKMYEGFGKAEVILSLYRGCLNKNVANKPNWILQILVAIKILFSSGKLKIKNHVKLRHDIAYAKELILNRKNYNNAKKQINNLLNRTTNNNIN